MAVGDRVLVSGGAGFIGAYLCERLLKSGHDVVCMDNFSAPLAEPLPGLLDALTTLEHDATEAFSVRVDQIYHLARPAQTGTDSLSTERQLQERMLSTRHMLACARENHARLLVASAPAVYGDGDGSPAREDAYGSINPAAPHAPEGISLQAAESLFFAERRNEAYPLKLARIFSVYGPHMSSAPDRLVGDYIVKALSGAPILLDGDGSALHAFCFIDDMVDGLIGLMNSPAEISGPVNLGGLSVCSQRELAEKIVDLTGSGSQILSGPAHSAQAKAGLPDLARARQQLGWQPQTDLETGLALTIAYFEMLMTRKAMRTLNFHSICRIAGRSAAG